MGPNRYKRMRKQLQRRVGWGQLALLGILVVSFINQLMLWMGIEYHFLFSAAMPYYLNWVARQLSSGGFSVVATVLTLALYCAYGLCLLRSYEPRWFWAGMVLYALDTVLLIIFALALLANPMSCLLELLVHGLALAVLMQSWSARIRLRQMPPRVPEAH